MADTIVRQDEVSREKKEAFAGKLTCLTCLPLIIFDVADTPTQIHGFTQRCREVEQLSPLRFVLSQTRVRHVPEATFAQYQLTFLS